MSVKLGNAGDKVLIRERLLVRNLIDKQVPIIVLVVLSILFSVGSSSAGNMGIGSEMQEKLGQSRVLLQQAQSKLTSGRSGNEEIDNLKFLAREIKVLHILVKEKFRIRAGDVKTKGDRAEERHRAMEEGYLEDLGDYLSLIGNLQDSANGDNLVLIEKLICIKPVKHL